jgi:hypothetical protein
MGRNDPPAPEAAERVRGRVRTREGSAAEPPRGDLRLSDLLGAIARAWWAVPITMAITLAIAAAVVATSDRVVEARQALYLGQGATPQGAPIPNSVISDPEANTRLVTADRLRAAVDAAGDACRGAAPTEKATNIPRPSRPNAVPTLIEVIVRSGTSRCSTAAVTNLAGLVREANRSGYIAETEKTLTSSIETYNRQLEDITRSLEDARERVAAIEGSRLPAEQKTLIISAISSSTEPLLVNRGVTLENLRNAQLQLEQVQGLNGAIPSGAVKTAVVSPTYRRTLPVGALAGLLLGLIAALAIGLRRRPTALT